MLALSQNEIIIAETVILFPVQTNPPKIRQTLAAGSSNSLYLQSQSCRDTHTHSKQWDTNTDIHNYSLKILIHNRCLGPFS